MNKSQQYIQKRLEEIGNPDKPDTITSILTLQQVFQTKKRVHHFMFSYVTPEGDIHFLPICVRKLPKNQDFQYYAYEHEYNDSTGWFIFDACRRVVQDIVLLKHIHKKEAKKITENTKRITFYIGDFVIKTRHRYKSPNPSKPWCSQEQEVFLPMSMLVE